MSAPLSHCYQHDVKSIFAWCYKCAKEWIALVCDLDIYRTAQVLIDQHGDAADIEAAKLADAMLAKGDLEGRAVWLRVIAAIEQMRAREAGGGTVH